MKNERIPLYNPTDKDFSVKMAQPDGRQKKFTIKKDKIEYFEPVVAEHIKKHLANKMLNDNWPADKNVEVALEKINKQIEVPIKNG